MAFITSQVGAMIRTWLGAAGELAVCREPGHGEICLAPWGKHYLILGRFGRHLGILQGFGGKIK